MIRTSAPGKLFLLGEYAVLEGAPALLTAVDRRVRVSVDGSGDDRWRLSAPGTALDDLELGQRGELPATLSPSTRRTLRLFDSVRAAIAGMAPAGPVRGRARDGLSITIDSTAFSHDGHKLGLGSSAAVAVALAAALAEARGLPLERERLFQCAHSAHRAAQDGAGSGGDIAASVHGGLLSYACEATPRPLHWPEDLTLTVVATGTGSSTTELVGRVAAYAARSGATYRTDLLRLAGLAGQAERALGSAGDFLELAEAYHEALTILDEHAQAGIISARHRQLHAVAANVGAVFKSSGAGGGDVALAFSRTGSPTRELRAALSAAGATVIPLGFQAAGLEDGS